MPEVRPQFQTLAESIKFGDWISFVTFDKLEDVELPSVRRGSVIQMRKDQLVVRERYTDRVFYVEGSGLTLVSRSHDLCQKNLEASINGLLDIAKKRKAEVDGKIARLKEQLSWSKAQLKEYKDKLRTDKVIIDERRRARHGR